MFRTIKLKLPYDKSLLETGERFREACQKVLDYGFSAHTFNKNKLNRATYEDIRKAIPMLPSALVQTARDTASESLKQTQLQKKIHMNSLTIRYNRRTFKFYSDSHAISLTTVSGRLVFPVAHSPHIEKYRDEYTNAQVFIDTSHRKMSVMIQVKIPDKEVERKVDLIETGRIDPSLKTCSKCGSIKHDLKLSDRIYHCNECALSTNRDLNASINIRNIRMIKAGRGPPELTPVESAKVAELSKGGLRVAIL